MKKLSKTLILGMLSFVILIGAEECPTDIDNPLSVIRYAAPIEGDGGVIPIGGVWGTKGGAGTRAEPYTVSDFWADTLTKEEGNKLVLLDGEYRGKDSMIIPPRNHNGTADSWIHVRAENDGEVLIDGELENSAVGISGNYYLLEGFDATTQSRQVIGISGEGDNADAAVVAHHVTLRRIVAHRDPIYGATVAEYITAGTHENSHVVGLNRTSDVLLEDFAAFGRGRKIIQVYKSNKPTARRVWARWDGNWPFAGGRQMAFSCSYRSVDSTCENIIATAGGSFDPKITPAPGVLTDISIKGKIIHDFDYSNVGGEGIGACATPHQIDEPYGLDVAAQPYLTPATRDPQSINMKLLGSIIYADMNKRMQTSPGILFGGTVYPSKGAKSTTIRDVAVWLPYMGGKPVVLSNCDDDPFIDFPGGCSYSVGDDRETSPKTVTDVTLIGGGNLGRGYHSAIGSDWIRTNVEELKDTDDGRTEEDPRYGIDIFTPGGTGASVCHRYVDGIKTDEPLWPWPMQERIKAATERSLFDTADVRAEIEAVFGAIPEECIKK